MSYVLNYDTWHMKKADAGSLYNQPAAKTVCGLTVIPAQSSETTPTTAKPCPHCAQGKSLFG